MSAWPQRDGAHDIITFRVGHERRKAAVSGRDGRQTGWAAIRVERVSLRWCTTMIDKPQRADGEIRIALLAEIGVTLAVRDGHRNARTRHAFEEKRRRIHHLNQRQPCFVFLGDVAREARPVLRARNDRGEGGHHLATVAHTKPKGVLARKIGGELVVELRVEQNAACPAFTRTQGIAVAETADRDKTLESRQVD